MKYEFDREGWSFLAQSYIESLRFPTKKMRFYYEKYVMLQPFELPVQVLVSE